jgi:hypothetical protein
MEGKQFNAACAGRYLRSMQAGRVRHGQDGQQQASPPPPAPFSSVQMGGVGECKTHSQWERRSSILGILKGAGALGGPSSGLAVGLSPPAPSSASAARSAACPASSVQTHTHMHKSHHVMPGKVIGRSGVLRLSYSAACTEASCHHPSFQNPCTPSISSSSP